MDTAINVLTIAIIVLFAVALLLFLLPYFRIVEEGTALVVRRLGRHRAVRYPGLHFLIPGLDEEVATLTIREQEKRLLIPNIFTDGGIPLGVELRFTFRIDPEKMPVDRMYMPETEREQGLERVLKQSLEEAMGVARQQATQSAKAETNNPAAVDFERLFAPLLGKTRAIVMEELRRRAAARAEEKLGYILQPDSLIINRFELGPGLVRAIGELLESNFTAAAQARFMQSVRLAAPDMEPHALVQLYNAILRNPGEFRMIVAHGGLIPDFRVREGEIMLRPPYRTEMEGGPEPKAAPGTPETRITSPPPTQSAAQSAGPSAPPEDLPLTAEDMALLRDLPEA